MPPPSEDPDDPKADDATDAKTVELRFYATFRDAVGQKSVTVDISDEGTLGDALTRVTDEYSDLDGKLLDDDGQLRDEVRALRNGRESANEDTRLHDGDEVSFMTPIHGG